MAIFNEKFIFYHIPRAGGHSMVQILYNKMIPFKYTGSPHDNYETVPPEGKFTFLFIRHPLEWYRSWWKFQLTQSLNITREFYDKCWDEDFNVFIDNVIEKTPGYLNHYYRWFIGEPSVISFIGRQELYIKDLKEIFTQIGYQEPNPRSIMWVKEQNLSPNVKADYTFEQRKTIMELEKDVINKWYSDFDPELVGRRVGVN